MITAADLVGECIAMFPFYRRGRVKIVLYAHFYGAAVAEREPDGVQIVLPEESVPELMERILKLQQPSRTDRLIEQYRSERSTTMPRQKFHAQIVSIAA